MSSEFGGEVDSWHPVVQAELLASIHRYGEKFAGHPTAEFYDRIFESCEIHPSRAIVVDDQAMCLDWAEEAGTRVIQARIRPDAPEAEFPIVLTQLSDLPALIRDLQ